MTLDVRLITEAPELAHLGEALDTLALSRGLQTDLYDTGTWLAAWRETAPFEHAASYTVAAAFEGDRLVAALPLLAPEGAAWKIAGYGLRPRYRVLVEGETPSEAARAGLDAIAEELARAGVRELELLVMPDRDPATALLERSLAAAGFDVDTRSGTEDCLALLAPELAGASPEEAWAAHRKRFKKFDRTVKNFANKAKRLGEVELLVYGEPGGPPVLEGYPVYVALHGVGWKGQIREATREHRENLLDHAARRGWARLYVLTVAGVPAAAIIWFKVGAGLFAYSTVYDVRLAALSAGTVVMWEAHERLFAEGTPRFVDYLPGHGAQKSQLGPDRSPLRSIHATRASKVASLAGAFGRKAKRALGAARRAVLDGDEAPREEAQAPSKGRDTLFEPAGSGEASLDKLDLTPPRELFLAVAGGFGSPKKMAEAWSDDDWCYPVGDAPQAIARLAPPPLDEGAPRRVVELVLLEEASPQELVQSLADALGQPLVASLPDDEGDAQPALLVTRAILPWVG